MNVYTAMTLQAMAKVQAGHRALSLSALLLQCKEPLTIVTSALRHQLLPLHLLLQNSSLSLSSALASAAAVQPLFDAMGQSFVPDRQVSTVIHVQYISQLATSA